MAQVGLTILIPKSISLPISAMAWYIFENTIKQRANTARDQYLLPWPICKYVQLISPYIGMLWKVFKVNKAKSLQVPMNHFDKCYQRKLERNIYFLNLYHFCLLNLTDWSRWIPLHRHFGILPRHHNYCKPLLFARTLFAKVREVRGTQK